MTSVATRAVTVTAPAIVPAVAATAAWPDTSVIAEAASSATVAPLSGTAYETVTPGTRLPY